MYASVCILEGDVLSLAIKVYADQKGYKPFVFSFSHLNSKKQQIVNRLYPYAKFIRTCDIDDDTYQPYIDIISVLSNLKKKDINKTILFVNRKLILNKVPNVDIVYYPKRNPKKFVDKVIRKFPNFKQQILIGHNCDNEIECHSCDKCLEKAILLLGYKEFNLHKRYLFSVKKSIKLYPFWMRKYIRSF